MDISPAAITAIRSFVTDWTPDDATIMESLNAATIDNPTPQPNVPKSVYPSIILGMLSPASLVKIDTSGFAGKLYDDLNAGNNAGVARWAMYYAGIGSITEAEAGAVVAQAQGTEPDPEWPALVSWSHINIGRDLDLSDIAASRPE